MKREEETNLKLKRKYQIHEVLYTTENHWLIDYVMWESLVK
jgi:hypothetical protein